MHLLRWTVSIWLLAAGACLAQGMQKGVIVTGEGRVSVAPDMATISLGVTHRAKDAKEAVTLTTNAVAGILSGLQERGIQRQDLQTSRFFLQPVWSDVSPDRDGARQIDGYVSGNSVTVIVRDLRFLGEVIDAAVDMGGNDFNGLQFSLRDDSQLKARAREMAVKDAVQKAEQLATAAGQRIGSVLQITETGRNDSPVMAEMSMQRSMGEAIAPGEIDVTASVRMVFAIRPDI